jgi:hypothetical protein
VPLSHPPPFSVHRTILIPLCLLIERMSLRDFLLIILAGANFFSINIKIISCPLSQIFTPKHHRKGFNNCDMIHQLKRDKLILTKKTFYALGASHSQFASIMKIKFTIFVSFVSWRWMVGKRKVNEGSKKKLENCVTKNMCIEERKSEEGR